MQAPPPSPQVEEFISVTVQTPDRLQGPSFQGIVPSTATVAHLKGEVYRVTRVYQKELRIICAGRELLDTETIASLPAPPKEYPSVVCVLKSGQWPPPAPKSPVARDPGGGGFFDFGDADGKQLEGELEADGDRCDESEEGSGLGGDDGDGSDQAPGEGEAPEPLHDDSWLFCPPDWPTGPEPEPLLPVDNKSKAADALLSKARALTCALQTPGLPQSILEMRFAATTEAFDLALAAAVSDGQRAQCHRGLGEARAFWLKRSKGLLGNAARLLLSADLMASYGSAASLDPAHPAADQARFASELKILGDVASDVRLDLFTRAATALPIAPAASQSHAAAGSGLRPHAALANAVVDIIIAVDNALSAEEEDIDALLIKYAKAVKVEVMLRAKAIAKLRLPSPDAPGFESAAAGANEMYESLSASISGAISVGRDFMLPLPQRLGVIESLERTLDAGGLSGARVLDPSRARLAFNAAQLCLNAATVSAESCDYVHGISQAEQGFEALERARVHHRAIAVGNSPWPFADRLKTELETLAVGLRIQNAIIRSTQARSEADSLLRAHLNDTLTINPHYLVEAVCDRFLAASALVTSYAGDDGEEEIIVDYEHKAAAHARLGYTYLKALIGHLPDARARAEVHYYKSADFVLNARRLYLRDLEAKPWCVDMRIAIDGFKKGALRLVEVSDTIWATAACGPAELIHYVYTYHQPPVVRSNDFHSEQWWKELRVLDSGMCELLTQAIADYEEEALRGNATHPTWRLIAAEIVKSLKFCAN